MNVNIIGESVYSTGSPAGLAENIGLNVKEGEINLRKVCGGDTLGRIAEGLSQGAIYPGALSSLGERKWATKAPEKGWKEVSVAYVHSGDQAGRLQEQAEKNSNHLLAGAALIFPGQYIALKDIVVVVGNTKEDVVSYLEGKTIKKL